MSYAMNDLSSVFSHYDKDLKTNTSKPNIPKGDVKDGKSGK